MKLQTQFSLVFVPLLLLSGGGLTYLSRQAVHRVILQEEASRGQEYMEQLSLDAAPWLEIGSEAELLRLLSRTMARQGAVYVMALDANGRVTANTSILEQGKHYDDETTRTAIRSNEPVVQETVWQNRPVLDLSWPVWQQGSGGKPSGEEFLLSAGQDESKRRRLGTLRLGLPLTRSLQIEKRITQDLIVLMAIAGVLLMSMVFLLLRNILRPVAKLVAATDDIAQGHYGSSVPVPSASELALLAQSFNRMIERLGQTTVSKDFLDTILTNMQDPLIVLDVAGEIRLVNRAALELFGYEPQELPGQPATVLFEGTDRVFTRLRNQKRMTDQEQEWKTKSGARIPVLFSGSVLESDGHNPEGWIFVVKDMRERKKLEREMVQAEKLSAVGRLASGVAHEINNPLGVIMGFAQAILWDVKPGDPLEDPLKSIERESMRCKHLVEELLTFSRVSKTEREPMALNQAVEGALALVTAQARLGKVTVNKELGQGLPHILGNPNQIQQVVINLANNALDAMKQEGTLTVRTSTINDSGRPWVVLTVTDTGPGIPKEVLPRIFEPFFTTKPAGQGTGLGLGLVSEIVQKHSATIQVHSEPGRTEFQICFPAAG